MNPDHMRRPISRAFLPLLCGIAVVGATSAQAATGDASFALKPITYDPALAATKSYFVLVTRPGTLITDHVRVVNTGHRMGTAYLYSVDATTGQTSGAVYLSKQSPRRDVGAWIRLARSSITLAPGASAIVPFTIQVPHGARTGDHLGGIVAENASVTRSSGKGSLQIRIKHLTIVAVELQLPGRLVGTVDVSRVKPGGEHGYQYVYLHLLSPGTIMIKPAGSLLVENTQGQKVAQRRFQLDTFLPHTEIDYPVLLSHQALKPGRYRATVNLHTSQSRVLGYGKATAPPFNITRRFGFVVSSREQTKVYSGAAAVGPTTRAGGSTNRLLVATVVVLAFLLALVATALLVWVRRTRRTAQLRLP
jgi:hypothetical protein